jgi:hypothetical protein
MGFVAAYFILVFLFRIGVFYLKESQPDPVGQ